MDSTEYLAYVERTEYYNASQRTVLGLSGFVFRKDPDIKFPDKGIDLIKKSIGTEAEGLKVVGQNATQEVLTTGRAGYLVDAPLKTPAVPAPNPYISVYFAENIINWQYTWIAGEKVLTMVVLQEEVESADSDDSEGFAQIATTQFRVLLLKPQDDGSWTYVQQIWSPVGEADDMNEEGEQEFEMSDEITPTQWGGRVLNRIPFEFQNPVDASDKIYNPPILDLVNCNLSHYRSSADLEHGRHYTALPTAWASGWELQAGQELTIGASKAWVTSTVGAKAGFLEFTGQGLGSLEKALQTKEGHMSVLGARILDEGKKEAESADTVKFRHAGEQNTLGVVVGAVSEGLTKVLKTVAVWMAMDPTDVSVNLNKDFGITGMEPGLLISLLQSLQNGAMSFETWYFNLQRGQMYAPDWTLEQEKARIAAGTPVPMPGAAISDPGGPENNRNTAITSGNSDASAD